MLEIEMNDTPLDLCNYWHTCDRRIFSSVGVARFDRGIAGQRLPRDGVSFGPTYRVDSSLASTTRGVDVGSVGFEVSLTYEEKSPLFFSQSQLKIRRRSDHSNQR